MWKLMRKKTLTILLLLLHALTLGCMLLLREPEPLQQLPAVTPYPEAETDSASLYFTRPYMPFSEDLRGGPDEALAEAILSAQDSVNMAIYNLTLWSIRDALLEAASKGIHVRVVTEANNLDSPEIRSLQHAGIPVHSDDRDHLMHHKFTVIDEQEVWTGSMNYTVRGAYHNNNHLIRILSPEIAADYTHEFEEMFVDDAFGQLSLTDTPFPEAMLGDVLVEVYFSPDEGKVGGYRISSRIVELIQQAERSVHMLAFSYTSDPITEVLLAAHVRGVAVSGVVEASQVNASGADALTLQEAGVDIRLDGNPDTMHHKVIILDEEILILGSYNFTRSAEEKNDENLLILHSPTLASQFLIEFDRIYDNAVFSTD